MITSPEDYLKLLYKIQDENRRTQAILLPKDETIYDVNLNTRKIQAPEFLSVNQDHNSETVYFKVDRYFDNMDLTNTVCLVQYVNQNAVNEHGQPAGGFAYHVPFYDIDHFRDENKILLPWMIGGPATAAAGPIQFSLKFYLVEKRDEENPDQQRKIIYELNTLAATSKILYGLDVVNNDEENFIIPSSTVEQIYQDIDALKNIGGTYWIDLY